MSPALVVVLGAVAGVIAALVSRRARSGGLELGALGGAAGRGPSSSTASSSKCGPIRDYAAQDWQTECDPTPKPGMVAFSAWVTKTYGGTSGGIARACELGGKSEHKEGRGWDWFPAKAADADRAIADLLATDACGRPHALARLWGVQYLIWQRRMWRAYGPPESGAWHPYAGASPHTDHVHVTLSREAAAHPIEAT